MKKRSWKRKRKLEQELQSPNYEDDGVLPNQISFEELFAGVDFSKTVDETIESIVPSEDQAKKMASVTDAVVETKSPKKKIWSFVFLVINILIVLFIFMGMLEGDNVVRFDDLDLDGWWLLVVISCFVIVMLTEQMRMMILTKRATKRSRPFLSYKVASIGRYYDCITPLATGGQPFQVYYLTQRGIKTSSAISIPLAKYIMQTLAYNLLSIVIIIGSVTFFKTGISGTGTTLVSLACWIGFILNIAVFLCTILISTSRLGHKIVIGVLKLLNKMRIVRDYDKYYAKLLNIVEEYQRTIKFFAKSPKLLIAMFFLSFMPLLINYSVPFFIYCCFGGAFDVNLWIQMIAISLMIDLAASFIPLPGGTGVSELSFTAVFISAFGADTFWALLLWRVVTYYSYILQGFAITVYDYFIGNKKNERLLKKWANEEKSKNQHT